ncbi:MAG: ATP-binding cassette domain-containing protein, partial [Pseudomonadota bacterium]|nr:ATP-binding cassette domain-containing protein [Pseudomonadota bacterium]
LIEDFHLCAFINRLGFQLSGGERRRCEVARALASGANGPTYLLLDEPFAGLDLPTTLSLTRYLDGVSPALIHISHDLDALADYDRVLWVEQGRIERDGPAKEVIAAYVAAMKGQGSSDDFADL